MAMRLSRFCLLLLVLIDILLPNGRTAADVPRVRVLVTYGQQLSNVVYPPGATIHHEFHDIRTAAITIAESQVDTLSSDLSVENVETDYSRYLMDLESPSSLVRTLRGVSQQQSDDDPTTTTDSFSLSNDERMLQVNGYGFGAVQASEAHQIQANGQNIKVCIIDTGVALSHPDFDPLHFDGFSFYSPEKPWSQDDNGHGTHITGIIAAQNGNSIAIDGVAPDADIFMMKAFDGRLIHSSDLIDSTYRCVQAGANIINMGLAGHNPINTERLVFQNVLAQNVLLVAAAGNSGENKPKKYPASYDGVISVAAIDRNMNVAYFSEANEAVDLAAPGLDIYSTYPFGSHKRLRGGTSQACAYVSGVAASVWSTSPNATASAIRDALFASARDFGPDGRDDFYGHGLVQAMDAIMCLNQQNCTTESAPSVELRTPFPTAPTPRPTTPRPSRPPTPQPTVAPTQNPTLTTSPTPPPSSPIPTIEPSVFPTTLPSLELSATPTISPTPAPTLSPTPGPTPPPTQNPVTFPPTLAPTLPPTPAPTTRSPSLAPTTRSPTPAPTPQPVTPAPTTFGQFLIDLVQAEIPSISFEDSASPQNSALQWMLSDTYTLSRGLSNYRLIQRFALITFWLRANGPNTWFYTGFERPIHECSWCECFICDSNRIVLEIDIDIPSSGLLGELAPELGLLSQLTSLNLRGNDGLRSTFIPTEIGLMTSLVNLNLEGNELQGLIPSELGQLSQLTSLELANNNFKGLIPTDVGRLANLVSLGLQQNELSGQIPSVLCDLTQPVVDCQELECDCCVASNGGLCSSFAPTRSPTPAPTPFPTFLSTPLPTPAPVPAPVFAPISPGTPRPTPLPLQPITPPILAFCQPFSSIGFNSLSLNLNFDDAYATLNLPFTFRWRGVESVTQIVVTTNGVIWVGTSFFSSGCCFASPIGLGGTYSAPRIAVAQEDLDLTFSGSMYAAFVNGAVVISWEGVSHYGADTSLYSMDFQAALYPNGGVELRWGSGRVPSFENVVAGLESDGAGVAVPATGFPFGNGGVTSVGTWPSNQCRSFTPYEGNYYETS